MNLLAPLHEPCPVLLSCHQELEVHKVLVIVGFAVVGDDLPGVFLEGRNESGVAIVDVSLEGVVEIPYFSSL